MTGWAMDELMLVGVMMALLVLGGSLMGWLSMLRILRLRHQRIPARHNSMNEVCNGVT